MISCHKMINKQYKRKILVINTCTTSFVLVFTYAMIMSLLLLNLLQNLYFLFVVLVFHCLFLTFVKMYVQYSESKHSFLFHQVKAMFSLFPYFLLHGNFYRHIYVLQLTWDFFAIKCIPALKKDFEQILKCEINSMSFCLLCFGHLGK